jgi:hypothetical protein
MKTFEEIEQLVNEFPTRFKEGFIYKEKIAFCELHNINVKKFHAALGITTCLVINNKTVTYKRDIIYAIEKIFSGKLDKYNFD